MVVKYRFDDKLKDALKEIDEMYVNHKTVYLEVDMNPYYI